MHLQIFPTHKYHTNTSHILIGSYTKKKTAKRYALKYIIYITSFESNNSMSQKKQSRKTKPMKN